MRMISQAFFTRWSQMVVTARHGIVAGMMAVECQDGGIADTTPLS